MDPATSTTSMEQEIRKACARLQTDMTVAEYTETNLQTCLTNWMTQEECTRLEKRIQELNPKIKETLYTQLWSIRSKESAMNGENKIQIKGRICPSHCMCLFVCGLLKHETMSFDAWLQTHTMDAYVADFLNDIIKVGREINVDVTADIEDSTDLSALVNDGTRVNGSCFICAEEDVHPRAGNLVFLDVFSSPDKFAKYPPDVWHLYCIWLFDSTQGMLCYGLSAGAISYVFLGHYSEHAHHVKDSATASTSSADVVPY